MNLASNNISLGIRSHRKKTEEVSTYFLKKRVWPSKLPTYSISHLQG